MLKFLAAASVALVLSFGSAGAASLEAYGRLPSLASVEISPDGTAIALIATVGEERHIIVRALSGEVLASATIGDRKVRRVAWADADHVLIEASSTTSIEDTTLVGEHWQAASLNIRKGTFTQLPVRSQDGFLNILVDHLQPGTSGKKAVVYTPLIVTVAGNAQHKGSRRDLFRIDLDSGMADRVQMGDNGTYGYLVQSDGTVLAKTTFDERGHEDKAVWTLWLRRDNRWIQAVSTIDALEFPDLWGVTPDGQTLIIDTWDDTEKMWRPTRVSRADGKLGEFIGPPREQSPLLDSSGVVLGFSHQDRFVEYDFVEPRLKALWPAYRAAFKDQQVSLVSWTPDLRKLILYVAGPGNPGGYYIADTPTKRVDPIGSAYPKVTAADVGTVRFVDYKAADGLDIQGVLTLPRGKPEKNLPLIVFPHGGPRAHDDLSFDWWAQALASRGYAVLQPNFRGSTGYGRAFLEAGYGEWGAKMQTDLSDGVADLARQGVIDPKRVCIVGASYGGYAALAGVSLQKGVYRCAVSVAGPSDLAGRLHDEILRYGERSTAIRDRKRLYGVDSENDPKLKARSPAAHADAVQVPVLLIHGKDDTVVPFSESQKMASALKAESKSYEIVALDGEDHNLSKSLTRQQMLTATVTFLEKNNPPN